MASNIDWYGAGFDEAVRRCRDESERFDIINNLVDDISMEDTRRWLDGVIDGAEREGRSVLGLRLERPQFNEFGGMNSPPNGGEYRGVKTVRVGFEIPARVEVAIAAAPPKK
ncbi:hypothetical protein [Devosia sp.]|uniref:hypothetical protein n=1 Tax=Devosia sp. TaxID=1871048 RepID=UPI002EF9A74C